MTADTSKPTSKPGVSKKPRRQFTARQDAFVEAYAKTKNATLAAIEAGYSPHTAKQQGSRLLTDVDLQQRVQAYGQLGLDVLATIAYEGKVEVARVQAAKILTERAFGMARMNDADRGKVPNVTLVFNRVDAIQPTGVNPPSTISIEPPQNPSETV